MTPPPFDADDLDLPEGVERVWNMLDAALANCRDLPDEEIIQAIVCFLMERVAETTDPEGDEEFMELMRSALENARAEALN
jgi:hypothetical protein